MLTLHTLCVGFTDYLADIIVLLVLTGCIFLCARRGFIDCFFEFVSTVAAFLTALLFTKAVVSLTGGLFGLQDLMSGSLEKSFLNIKAFQTDISNEGMEAALRANNIPTFLVRLIVNAFADETLPVGTTIATLAGGAVARLATMLIVFASLYALARVALFFMRKILTDLAKKITLVHKVNTVLGGVAGFIEGLLILYAVLSLLSLIPSENIMSYMDNSILLGFLYNHNLLNILLGLFIGS